MPSCPQNTPHSYYTPTSSYPQYKPRPYYTPRPHHTPQACSSQIPLRTLEVHFTNWTSTHIRVAQIGLDTPELYTADLSIQKPHLTFKTSSANSTIGTVEFGYFTPDIGIRVNGRETTLRMKKGLEPETTFESPALQDTCLSWKTKTTSNAFNFECLDEDSTLLARFTASSSWTKTRTGQLELFGSRVASGAAMDEVVVTGLALAHYALTG
jgi:hypothetical protein